MKRLSIALLSLIVGNASPVLAGDYVLKVEMTTEVDSKVGDGKPIKKSDVRMLEITITPDRRFHGRTTWENQRLAIKGKLTEEKGGTLRLDIDCRHAERIVPPGSSEDGPSPAEIENHTSAKGTFGITGGQPRFLGGMMTSQTSETPHGTLHEKQTMSLRVTIVEDGADES